MPKKKVKKSKKQSFNYLLLAIAVLLLVFVSVIMYYSYFVGEDGEMVSKAAYPLKDLTGNSISTNVSVLNNVPIVEGISSFSNYTSMASNVQATNFTLCNPPDLVTVHIQINISDNNSFLDITNNGYVKVRMIALDPDGSENTADFDTGYIITSLETGNSINATFYRPINIKQMNFTTASRNFVVSSEVNDGTASTFSINNLTINITKDSCVAVDIVDLSLYDDDNVSFIVETSNHSLYLSDTPSSNTAIATFYSVPVGFTLATGQGALVDEDDDMDYDYLITLESMLGDTARYTVDDVDIPYTPPPTPTSILGGGGGGGGGAPRIIEVNASGGSDKIIMIKYYPMPPEQEKAPKEEVPGVVIPPELKALFERESLSVIEIIKFELKKNLALPDIDARVDAQFDADMITEIKTNLGPIVIADYLSDTQKEGKIDRLILKNYDYIARDLLFEHKGKISRFLTKNNIGLFFKHSLDIKKAVKTFNYDAVIKKPEFVLFKINDRVVVYLTLDKGNLKGEFFPSNIRFTMPRYTAKEFDINGDMQNDLRLEFKELNDNGAEVIVDSLVSPMIIHEKRGKYELIDSMSRIPDLLWSVVFILLIAVVLLLVSTILKEQRLKDMVRLEEEEKHHLKKYIDELKKRGHSEHFIVRRLNAKLEDYIYKTREAGYSDDAIAKRLVGIGLKMKYVEKLMEKTKRIY